MKANQNMSIAISAIALIFFLQSCNNVEMDRIKNENLVLRKELDSIKNIESAKKRFLGTYVNTRGGLYAAFDFRGESTVLVIDGIVGWKYASSYERDGNIIRISTDKTDLVLTVQDSNTLIGEGFASGTYKKGKLGRSVSNSQEGNKSSTVKRKKANQNDSIESNSEEDESLEESDTEY